MSIAEQVAALPKSTILDLIKNLNGGSIGFDHERVKKAECAERLMAFGEERVSALINGDTAAAAAPTVEKVIKVGGGQSVAAPVTTTVDQSAIANQIAGLFATLAGSAVNEDRVRSIVDSAIADAVQRLVNRVEVVTAQGEVKDVGVQHSLFPVLLQACNARDHDGHRLNIYLRGGAAGGKTTAAKNVAKALDLPFYFNGAMISAHELLGFIDAGGNYHATQFRQAYEGGGVYIFDEGDASAPAALLALNAALANGVCAFPDRMVERHVDFVCLFGANTAGTGASADYSARNKLDAAFLDRFVEIEWQLDEKLEAAIVPNQEWVSRVQGVRARAKERGIKGHLITTRASVYGSALLAAGLPIETVERMTLKKGLADESWTNIR